MEMLKSILQKKSGWRVVLPSEAECKGGCGFWDVSHPEVIRRMAEAGRNLHDAECRCAQNNRENEQRESLRRSQANLPHEHTDFHRTFENFTAREGTHEAVKATQAFCRGEGASILVLVGTTGSGKSHLIEAVGRTILTSGESVRYELVADYIDRYRASYSQSSDIDAATLPGWYGTFSTMLLDDLDLERQTEFATEKLTQIVETRMQHGGRLIITTNLNYGEVEQKYGTRLASRLWDRSDRGTVSTIVLTATDYRA